MNRDERRHHGRDDQNGIDRADVGARVRLTLTTIGIDVGSATTRLAIARLTLIRVLGRYEIASREVLFGSEAMLTPYTTGNLIDATGVRAFVMAQLTASQTAPDEIDTGAVIFTGTAALRENATELAESLSAEIGDLVAVAAGDGLEALLAAHGSGSVAASERDGSVLNIDIGGGTTKLSLCRNGAVEAVTAIDVGSRLLVVDDAGALVRVEPAGQRLGALAHLDLAAGVRVTRDECDRLVRLMARLVAGAARLGPADAELRQVLRHPPLSARHPVSTIRLSGGTAEHLSGVPRDYGDLGADVAHAVVRELADGGFDVEVVADPGRCTVIGLSQFTTQVSGATVHTAADQLLPLRNVPMLRIKASAGAAGRAWSGLSERISLALETHAPPGRLLGLALPWEGEASYRAIDAYCGELVRGLTHAQRTYHTIVLVFDADVAALIGRHLEETPGWLAPVVVLDGLTISEFDYLDLGRPLNGSPSLPVVVRSLAIGGG